MANPVNPSHPDWAGRVQEARTTVYKVDDGTHPYNHGLQIDAIRKIQAEALTEAVKTQDKSLLEWAWRPLESWPAPIEILQDVLFEHVDPVENPEPYRMVKGFLQDKFPPRPPIWPGALPLVTNFFNALADRHGDSDKAAFLKGLALPNN